MAANPFETVYCRKGAIDLLKKTIEYPAEYGCRDYRDGEDSLQALKSVVQALGKRKVSGKQVIHEDGKVVADPDRDEIASHAVFCYLDSLSIYPGYPNIGYTRSEIVKEYMKGLLWTVVYQWDARYPDDLQPKKRTTLPQWLIEQTIQRLEAIEDQEIKNNGLAVVSESAKAAATVFAEALKKQ